jgi:hypothetical protein
VFHANLVGIYGVGYPDVGREHREGEHEDGVADDYQLRQAS